MAPARPYVVFAPRRRRFETLADACAYASAEARRTGLIWAVEHRPVR